MVISVHNLEAFVALVVGIFVFVNPKLAVRLIGAYLILKGLIGLGVLSF